MKKTIVITGVSSGIGEATAKLFRESGWMVIGISRRKPSGAGSPDHFIAADLADPESPGRILEGIKALTGEVHALVNNAAYQVCKPLVETTAEEWDKVFGTNVRAAFLLMRLLHPYLKKSGGAVINVSSVHAIATSADIAAYASSKGALLALTRAAALEFGRDGIRVNALIPGAVDTPMLRDGLSRGHVKGATTQQRVDDLGAKHVGGRIGTPAEIAQAVMFLADNEKSSFMTGQALVVDGGATARLSTE